MLHCGSLKDDLLENYEEYDLLASINLLQPNRQLSMVSGNDQSNTLDLESKRHIYLLELTICVSALGA